MTIIIDNIITPYEIARYNEINKVLKGRLEVWFQKGPYYPEILFKYCILPQNPIKRVSFLREFQRENKIERIICCGWDSYIYLYSFLFCKINKIRFTLWSGSTIYENSFLRNFCYPLIKFIVSYTDDYIAYGSRASDYLIRLGARKEKIRIFLNTVDVEYFRQKVFKLRMSKTKLLYKFGLDRNDTVFAFIGQLIDRKGVIELLNAFSIASMKYKNISLLIAGEGSLKNEITDFIKEHTKVKIKLLGYIDYNRLPEVYAMSDALVLPSKQEVWGLVVNEALASGIPVLVSRFAGCCVDLVDNNNGEIIAEITPYEIAAVLDKFLKKNKYVISNQVIEKMRLKNYAKTI